MVVVIREGDCRPACGEPARHAERAPASSRWPSHAGRLRPRGRQRQEQKAVWESARVRAEFLRELVGRRLPKASVIGLVLGAFLRSGQGAPGQGGLHLLGLEAPPALGDHYGARAVDELLRYAEGRRRPPATGGPGPGLRPWPRSIWARRGAPSAGADPSVLAHVRFSRTPATSATSSRTTASPRRPRPRGAGGRAPTLAGAPAPTRPRPGGVREPHRALDEDDSAAGGLG